MRRTKSPALPPPRVDDDVHAAFPDVMLVASADAHRSPDHSELRVPEPEGHRAERPLVAAVDVAMPEDHVLAVPGDRDLRPARAVELRLEDVAADVAHRHRIEQAFGIEEPTRIPRVLVGGTRLCGCHCSSPSSSASPQ
jgi:hypothetical protein